MVMELVAKVFMAKNSEIKISQSSMIDHICFQWQMLAQTQMDLNSLLQLLLLHG